MKCRKPDMLLNDYICAAEKDLYNARRYLETGEAANWVPDSLSAALYWAMEAWLMAHGYEVDRGRGWEGTRSAFMDNAPGQLRSEVMYCLSETSFLQYDVEGGFDHKEPLTPMDMWKETAHECLEETEKVVQHLLRDTGKQAPEKTRL